MLEAIATTLVRLSLTRRRLLQWTTAARTVRLFGDEVSAVTTWRAMFPSLLLVVALILGVSVVRPAALLVAAPFCLAWLLASQIAYLISRPWPQQVYTLSAEERQRLRTLARRTWLFYEQFVGPDDNWLPPDHFQEMPRGVLAQRTSPTNVGLYLLALLSAHDLGYIATSDYVLRLRFTFDTLARLERYRGHFLNWIDTHTLVPLPPRYVSTVDSGNLASCLIVLRHGCLALPQQPVWPWELWEGLLDTLALLAETVALRSRPEQPSALPWRRYASRFLPYALSQRTGILCSLVWPQTITPYCTATSCSLWKPLISTLRPCAPVAFTPSALTPSSPSCSGKSRRCCRGSILPSAGAVDQAGLPAAGHIPTWAELPALYDHLLAHLAHAPQPTALTTQVTPCPADRHRPAGRSG